MPGSLCPGIEGSVSTGQLGSVWTEFPVGAAIGKHICENGKGKHINDFKVSDFIQGFEHGYSLFNGIH
jgi:hypothetical protein